MPVVRGQFIGTGDVRGEYDEPDYSLDEFSCISRRVVIKMDEPTTPEPTTPTTPVTPTTPAAPTTPEATTPATGASKPEAEKALPTTGDPNSTVAFAAIALGGVLALGLSFAVGRTNE